MAIAETVPVLSQEDLTAIFRLVPVMIRFRVSTAVSAHAVWFVPCDGEFAALAAQFVSAIFWRFRRVL